MLDDVPLIISFLFFTMSNLLTLSNETICDIFRYLQANELIECMTTCKRIYHIATDESIWKQLYKREYQISFKPSSISWRQAYFWDHYNVCQHLDMLAKPHWMRQFMENWRRLFAAVKNNAHPELTCHACHHNYQTLWICMAPGCGYVGK
jgi:hypothetical protein